MHVLLKGDLTGRLNASLLMTMAAVVCVDR